MSNPNETPKSAVKRFAQDPSGHTWVNIYTETARFLGVQNRDKAQCIGRFFGILTSPVGLILGFIAYICCRNKLK